MARNNRELIYARATITVATAAQSLGIDVNLAALAPTLQRGEPLIPVAEHTSVVRKIFEDRRETLGIDLAQVLCANSFHHLTGDVLEESCV